MAHERTSIVLRHIRHLTRDQENATLQDRELLERFAAQHEETAFATLVRRHGRMVLGVCRRVLHQEQDAEDAFQATFLVLARKAAALRWKESVANWLYRVAFRLAVRARRQADRRQARERRTPPPSAADPLADVMLRDVQRVLDEELSKLPQKLRMPLVLCCLEGSTRDEAAQQLGWSVATLQRRLTRGRDLLALRLRRRGLTLPAVFAGLIYSESAAPAAVPPTLFATTVHAALLPSPAAGVPAAVSPATAALVRGMLRGMLVSKLALILGLVLTPATVAGIGAAVFWHAPHSDDRAAAERPEVPPGTPEGQPVRTDRGGDPLPAGVLVRLGSVRLRHKFAIRSVAFTDPATFATSDDAGLIRLWNAGTGKEVRRIAADGSDGPLACSPDGKLLAAYSSQAITLFDAATGKAIRRLLSSRKPSSTSRDFGSLCVPLSFSPDGQRLAALTGDPSVTVWEVATGRQLVELPAQKEPIVCVGFAPDGKNVLTVTGDRQQPVELRHWDAATGKEVHTVRIPQPGRQAWLRPLAIAPDGNTLALEEAAMVPRKEGKVTHVFTEYRLYLVDTASGKKGRRLDGVPSVVWSAAFTRDSKMVACQRMDGSVSVWDPATGKRRFSHPGYPGNSRPDSALTLAFTPDGQRLATVGDSGAIHLWDIATGSELLADPETHHGSVDCVTFAPNGDTVATGSHDHTIRLWDPASGRQRLRLPGHGADVNALAFSQDGRMLASAGRDDTVRLWDPATGKERRVFKEERTPRDLYTTYGVRALAFRDAGKTLAAWGEDQMLRMWDIDSGKERSARRVGLQGVPDTQPADRFAIADHVGWAAFTPDAATALLASNHAVHVVDVATALEVFQFPTSGYSWCRALSRDGALLVIGCADRSVAFFETATGKQVLRATVPYTLHVAAFAPDGRSLALTAPDGTIHLLDVANGKERTQLDGAAANVRALAYRPDGKMMASGLSDTTTLLWRMTPAPRLHKQDKLPAGSLDDLWDALAGSDAAKAHAAGWTLAAHPRDAVALLKERLRPAPAIDPKHIEKLIADLDHKEFARREQAFQELKRMRVAAGAALQAALKQSPQLEVGRRLQAILAAPPPWPPQTADALRRLRAIQVLEAIASPESAAILEQLAGGAASARETHLADAARKRLPR